MISEDGKKHTYYEHGGANWKIYQDLPAKSINYDSQYWGKGFKLSNLVQCYDWTSGDGYKNFAAWLEDAK